MAQAGPDNRVEGLPVELGPVINRQTSWGSVRFDAAVVVRTGSSFRSDKGDYGHNLRGEVRIGHNRGIGVGAQVSSEVDPVESWQLSDLEVALGSFLARRDYRDYYQRHGGRAFVTLYGRRDLSLTGSFGEERWSSRAVSDPFTVFNDDRPWRPNPVVDEGLFHVANTTLRFDTRTDPDDPSSGWYVNADVEHGRGVISAPGPTSDTRIILAGKIDDYTRGLFDLRRYNRLGPDAQLNMRVVVGGWRGGDALPLERRLSVAGPGALPGFDFRSPHPGFDVGTCNVGFLVSGQPAGASVSRSRRSSIAVICGSTSPATGRLAAALSQRARRCGLGDVRRAPAADGTPGRPRSRSFPIAGCFHSTFRSDIRSRARFGGIGVYAAKAVSDPSQPVNFFVRLRHRF